MKRTTVSTNTFDLGEVKHTERAIELLRQTRINPETLLERHRRGDWGYVYEEDRERNDEVLRSGQGVLVSQYLVAAFGLYVIATTVMVMGTGVITQLDVLRDATAQGLIRRLWCRLRLHQR